MADSYERFHEFDAYGYTEAQQRQPPQRSNVREQQPAHRATRQQAPQPREGRPQQGQARVTDINDHRQQAPAREAPRQEQMRPQYRQAATAAERPQHPAAESTEVSARTSNEARSNHHVYGRNAALTIEVDGRRSGAPTIAIDAAPKAGERAVNWSQKIRFQLTASELPIFAGVLLGMLPEIRFDFHGEARNKSLHVVHRNQVILARVMEGDTCHAVPMSPGDVYAVGMLALKALDANCPNMDATAHMAMVRMACKLWSLDPKNTPESNQSQARR